MITINYKFNIESYLSRFSHMEVRVSYVSSFTNSLGARIPHVSYVNLLMAGVSHASCINILAAGLSQIIICLFYYKSEG